VSDFTLVVDVGDGAKMFVPAPDLKDEGALEWQLRYGNPTAVRFQAASIVSSTEYLISKQISMREATRRLRLMRAAYRAQYPRVEQAPE
jgi:hypothetical protein